MPKQVMAQDDQAAQGVVRVLRTLLGQLPPDHPARRIDDDTLYRYALAAVQEHGNQLQDSHLEHLAEAIYAKLTTKDG